MTPFDVPYSLTLVFLFGLGLILGRFLNICIERLPLEDRFWASLRCIFNSPPACRCCNRHFCILENLPILGWLILKGRCPACRRSIPLRSVLIELLTAGLFVAVYWCEIPSHPHPSAAIKTSVAMLHWRYAYHMVLVLSLVVSTFIDFDLKIIPDGATLPAMAVGILGAVTIDHAYLVPLWYQGPFPGLFESLFPAQWESLWSVDRVPAWISVWPRLHGLLVSLAGILVGGGVVWAVRIGGHWAMKREAMGFGDVVLLATIGSFVGWQAAVTVFFLSPVCALLTVIVSWLLWRDRELPFGPYLSLGTLVILMGWTNFIWPAVERIFSLGILLPLLAAIMLGLLIVLLVFVRAVQRLLGIEQYDDWIEDWTPGDQLAFSAGKKVDPDQGQWPIEAWPGLQSGRGDWYRREWQRSKSGFGR